MCTVAIVDIACITLVFCWGHDGLLKMLSMCLNGKGVPLQVDVLGHNNHLAHHSRTDSCAM